MDRKRFMAAKHIPKNERHTNTNQIAAPGGVTAMRGDFVLIPRWRSHLRRQAIVGTSKNGRDLHQHALASRAF